MAIKRAVARIDLSALKHNLQRVREYAPGSKVMAAIKAEAYGHGALQVANALADADSLAVAHFEEAMQLRWAGEQRPVVLLGGVQDMDELLGAIEQKFQIVVHDLAQLQLLESLDSELGIDVWIKLDTGMHRLGFSADQLPEVIRVLSSLRNIRLLGWMSHFACADDVDSPFTGRQIDCFKQATGSLEGVRSLANSAAIISRPESHMDWVRPGIMLYGSSPMLGQVAADHDLQAVMSLESRLISVHEIKAGESIGYGQTWTCPEDMPVGVIGIGYGDGYPRHAPSGTPVFVNGQVLETVGRVSMDMTCVDLRPLPDAKVGDRVELWGKHISVDDVARKAGTISYELFCRLTSRVEFIYENTN